MDWLSYFFSFKGRITRNEYWRIIGFSFLIAVGLNIVNFAWASFLSPTQQEIDQMAFWPAMFVVLIFWIAVVSACVRRLHDIDRSGGWVFLVLLLSVFGIFFLGCIPGDRGMRNHFGPDPEKKAPH